MKRQIKCLENEFLFEFWPFIPEDIAKTAIDALSASTELEQISRRNGLPVISLDRVYLANADEYLEVTRTTNQKTGDVKISERPGNRPLSEQINGLKRYGKIVLADVGAFEGRTLLEISEMIERSGLNIEEIYLGFSSNEANKRINNSRKLTALNLFDFYEWIEMRDFFGIDGRNTGAADGRRLYIPYWENLTEWASVPGEKEQEIARLCIGYNKRLLRLLEQQGYNTGKFGTRIKYKGGG